MKPTTTYRVAVITGASEGIGAEVAERLAARWQHRLALVLSGKDETQLKHIATSCKQFGAACLLVRGGTASEYECRRLIREAVEAFGSVDILIHHAGKFAHALFSDVQNLAWYQELMRLNFWSGVWCAHAALPYLKQSRGKIVAISSVAGLIGSPGQTAYSASMFAISGFFDSLRSELQSAGVGVLVVYPDHFERIPETVGISPGNRAAEAEGNVLRDYAARIIEAMESEQHEVVLSTRGRLGRWLRLISPVLADKVIQPASQDSMMQ